MKKPIITLITIAMILAARAIGNNQKKLSQPRSNSLNCYQLVYGCCRFSDSRL